APFVAPVHPQSHPARAHLAARPVKHLARPSSERVSAMTTKSALPLDPATYVRHALHGETAQWREKNCYVDVWIEVIHAQGLDPIPSLAPALVADFETDQWTFFKPSHADLDALYGIDVQELQIWRPLIDHAVTQVGAG